LRRILSLVALIALLHPRDAVGGLFGEHKSIGDSAFARFLRDESIFRFFRDTLDMDISRSTGDQKLFSSRFAEVDYYITYGDLTGLSGDHESNPLTLYNDLLSRGTKVSRSLRANLQAIADNRKAASDVELTGIDLCYPFRAIIDKSHFYRLGQSFEQQLSSVNPAELTMLRGDLALLNQEVFEGLLESNAVAKYAALHSLALDVMNIAGIQMIDGTPYATRYALEYFELGLMLNAFGDHFLQDAYAGGHLAVDRSSCKALDNKGTHDYYCRNGIEVTNTRGDRWKEYGDGFIEIGGMDFDLAVESNIRSLKELWAAFLEGRDGGPSFLDQLTAQSDVPRFVLSRFKAFELMPLPVDPATIRFADSRDGIYYSVLVGLSSAWGQSGRSDPCFGVQIGAGLDAKNAPRDDTGRESLQWFSLNVSYLRSDNWQSIKGGIEGILLDCVSLGLSAGSVHRDNWRRFIISPALGFEYKPVTWSFAPALKCEWSVVSRAEPMFLVRLEMRYY